METYTVTLKRVVDGDTFDFKVVLGFNVFIEIRSRLLYVDTHETFGVSQDSIQYTKGIEEKSFVERWFANKKTLKIETDLKTGAYGRWLVLVKGDGEDLSDRLLHEFKDVATV